VARNSKPRNPDQIGLDFESAKRERFALVDAVTQRFMLLDQASRDELGISRRQWKNTAELLKKLHAFSNGEVSFASRQTLADSIGWTKDTPADGIVEASLMGALEELESPDLMF
jgi:hypothetical protein